MKTSLLFKKALQLWWKKNRFIFSLTFGLIFGLVLLSVYLSVNLPDNVQVIRETPLSKSEIAINTFFAMSKLFLFVPLFIYGLDILFLAIRVFASKLFALKLFFALFIPAMLLSVYSVYDRYSFAQNTQGAFNTRHIATELFKGTPCENKLSEFAFYEDKVIIRCNGTFFPEYDEVVIDTMNLSNNKTFSNFFKVEK